MDDQDKIDVQYHKYIENLPKWVPEGIADVDIDLLHRLGLLSFIRRQKCNVLDRFQVVYGPDKLTLINKDFIVWITAATHPPFSCFVLIALKKKDDLKLEHAFVAKGVYNTDDIIYRVLEKYLDEIIETERSIKNFR